MGCEARQDPICQKKKKEATAPKTFGQAEAERLAEEMAHLEAPPLARGNYLQTLVAPSDRSDVPFLPSPGKEDFDRFSPVTAFPETGSESDKGGTPEKKEADTFEFEPRTQASRLGS